MTKGELFTEMAVQITEMFEVKKIDFKTHNEKPEGEILGATMLFHSGLVVMMLTEKDKLQIVCGHISGAPYTQRMKNEKELLKSIWDSANAINEIIINKTSDELVEKFVRELIISYEDDGTINTNYWETEWNKEGFMYLTVGKNNVFNLLIPNSLEYVLDEMETGKYVVLTTGKTNRKKAMSMNTDVPDNVEMVELMFEDGTDSPFCTSLDIRQCSYKLGADLIVEKAH